MPLNAEAIAAHRFLPYEQVLGEKDTILFALSVGLGRDPMDESELSFVYEEGLKIFPTLPVVLGHPGPWMNDPRFAISRQMLVHGTQRLEVLGELRPGTRFIASNRILELVDKGPESGGIIILERTLTEAGTGVPIARLESGTFCRADGGFGGKRQLSREFRVVPARAPDASTEVHTQANQALWYRLNGDRNPLHASPAFAAKAGFPRPILHGLCTYSVVARGLMSLQPGRSLKMIECRFSKPVFPGETIRIDAWDVGAGGLAFRAKVDARDALVLDRGFAEFS